MSSTTTHVPCCCLLACACLLTTVAFAQPGPAPWPMCRGDAGATGAANSVGPAAASAMTVLAVRPGCDPVVGAGNTLFFVPSTGPALRAGFPLIALSPAPEETIWESRVGREPLALALWGHLLYVVASRGALSVLSAQDGAMVGQAAYAAQDGPEYRAHPPVVNESGVLFLSTEACVQAFTHGLTRQLWTWDSPRTDRAALMYLGPPVLGPGGLLLIAHTCGSLFALAANTGQLIWEFSTGTMSLTESSPLAASSDSILWAASTAPYERRLHCLNGKGEVRWSVDLPEALPSGIAVHEGRVAYLSRRGDLLCFNEEDGSLLWADHPVPAVPSSVAFQAPPVVDAAGSVFVTSGPRVLCYEISSGQQVWSADLPLGTSPRSLMLGSDGWLFATSPHGIVAIGPVRD